MIRATLKVLLATVLALLGSWLASAASADAAEASQVHAYAYDTPNADGSTNYTAAERGPPVGCVDQIVSGRQLLAGCGSHWTSPRLDARAAIGTYTYTYDGSAQLVQGSDTDTGVVEKPSADLSLLQSTGVAAETGTVAGEQATIHGAERLTQAGFDEATVAATKAGRVLQQADGATVYVNEVSPGKYDFIIQGERGVVTAHRGWSFKSVTRLAGNYGWQGWP